MVFGNSGNPFGAGVAFSRNPATGANEPYIDFLFDAQGEDVVSGRRTPGDATLLAKWLPDIARDLAVASRRLEQELKDVQDIEFTVEDGKLYFLQTRSAKRTPRAALRIAVDLVREGVITPAEALRSLEGINLERAGVATLRGEATPLATAISASPGVASGRIALDSETARRMAAAARQSYWFGASLDRRYCWVQRRRGTPPWLADAPLTRRWWRANLARPVWLDATAGDR